MGTIKKITNCITFCLFALFLSLTTTNTSAQESSFTTSNDRSLYDAQTRALRQKARTQLEKDTEKLKELKQTNEDLQNQTARIKECADLNKVYNGDPTGSNDPDTYCQAIVGALPNEINFKGLAAWFDASTADGYELDGNGKIQTLLDKSGNLNNLVQENANKRPTLITYGTEFDSQATNLNGKTALRFDGSQSNSTGDSLSTISTDAINALELSGDADFSIYMVIRSDSSYSNLNNYTNYMPLMALSHHYDESPLSYNRITISGNLTWNKPDYAFSFSHHSGGSTSGHSGVRTPGYVNRPLSFSIRRSPGEDITSTVNNITFTDTVNTPGVSLSKGRLVLGHHPSTSNGFYKGDILEVILYNRHLDSTSHASVQAYLKSKYGLVDFSACADETRNLTQCSASTGVKDHGQYSNIFCPGTYGNCRETLKCNDGTWEEYTAQSCPLPANCTSSTNRNIGECTASTGTANHSVTANLSCAGTYGTCSGKADCFNGAWGSAYNTSCPPPTTCPATTSPEGCILPETLMGESVTNTACTSGKIGYCDYTCTASGDWEPTLSQYNFPSALCSNACPTMASGFMFQKSWTTYVKDGVPTGGSSAWAYAPAVKITSSNEYLPYRSADGKSWYPNINLDMFDPRKSYEYTRTKAISAITLRCENGIWITGVTRVDNGLACTRKFTDYQNPDNDITNLYTLANCPY